MSISSEIDRISQNVADSLSAVAAQGVTVPTGATSDDLPSLIAQISGSGGSKTISLTSDDDTWAKIWAKIDTIDVRESVPFYSHTTPTGILSNNTRSNALIGVICKTATDGTFDIISRFGINNGVVLCRIEGASSASAGTYSERVIDDAYDDCGTVATQAALFSLLDTKLNDMSNYRTTQIHVSATAAISPFLSGARLMITLIRGASATYAAAIIQQAGAYTMATAGKSTTWSMQPIATGSNVASLVGLSVTQLSGAANGVTRNYTVANNTKMAVFAIGASTRSGLWIVNTTSSGSVSVVKVYSHDEIVLASNGTNGVKFTNNVPSSTSVTPSIYAVVFRGSVADAT